MSRTDNLYNNIFMEFCFNRFKAELMQDGVSQDKAEQMPKPKS